MIRRLTMAVAFCIAATGGLSAQAPLELFDAHLHYNQEPAPLYPLETVLEIFRRNGVTGIIATSRPNKGTHQLVEAQSKNLWVVPFIRPYRTRGDIQTWFNDPEIFELIKNEYARGYYRGIGEFHIYGKAAESDWVKKIVDFAVERNLYLHAHCDEEALLILFRPRLSLRFSLSPSRLCFLALVMSRFASRSVPWFLGTVLVRAAPSLRGVFGVGGGLGFPWLNSSSQHWSRSPALCL